MPTLKKFPDTREGHEAYRACLQNGDGFIANCCGGYPEGYMLHAASCKHLDRSKNRNPIMKDRGTGKIWAATLRELEENIWLRQPGRGPDRCRCLEPEAPEEFDTDMERESHLVVPGGQVESSRSRH